MSQATAAATEITMPRLSDSMEEGTILTWLVAAGKPVEEGQDLLEVETDKANMTVQAEGSGILEILAEEGATLPVGEPIARLAGGVAAGPASGGAAPAPAPPAPAPSGPAKPGMPEPAAPAATQPAPATTQPAPAAPKAAPATRDPASSDSKSRSATPLARRVAAVHGVALERIDRGSGIGGRVVKADVLAAAGAAEQPPPAFSSAAVAAAPAAPAARVPAQAGIETAKGASSTLELSRAQALIARRMAEAKATIPHFQVETEVRMDAAIVLREELKALAGADPAPSFNDLIVRAAALALRGHPKANGSYRDGALELHERINVGVAVAAQDALVVPTIFDADRMSLGEIGRETRRLAERVRAGTVTPPELAGGTFTVSNLGMYGMTAIYPVINVPQAAILGVGRMRQALVRGEDGEIVDATLMTLTLSCDHRVLYGAEAAEFLRAIGDSLESPLRVAL